MKGYNDLQTVNPSLANEWNYAKNGNLKPENFVRSSGKKVWWKCDKGHEWQATINNRNKGYGCPYCAGQKVIKGYNDLETINPILAKEWNCEKNNGLMPVDVMPNSNKKVWWKCSQGHEWQATISHRNSGRGCPYCSGKRFLKGYNDLKTINSDLAKEWNYEKNGSIKPENFLRSSEEKVWWKCEKGHEWQATITSRNRGRGCPYCLGKKVLRGYNDLQTINPILAKEWNYEKNYGLTPMDVMPNSDKKVWWKCNKGHEWQATINNRSNRRGCPYCSGKKVLKGYNDLQTVNPILAKEWNYEKNGDLRAEHFTKGSNEKVWWKCEKGHEWQATINSRSNGCGCPQCIRDKRNINK